MDFFSDIVAAAYAHLLGMFYGWPDNRTLGLYLQGINAKFHVTFWDLHRSGLFPSQKSMESFIIFYGVFDFCKPIEFNSWGKVDTSEQAEDREWMKTFLVSMLDKRPLKLKDLHTAEGAKAKKKKASLQSFTGSSTNLMFTPLVAGSNAPRAEMTSSPALCQDFVNGN